MKKVFFSLIIVFIHTALFSQPSTQFCRKYDLLGGNFLDFGYLTFADSLGYTTMISAYPDGGSLAFFLLRTDLDGNVVWKNFIPPLGGSTPFRHCCIKASDNNFVLLVEEPVSVYPFNYRIKMAKISPVGNIIWVKYFDNTVGGANVDFPRTIIETADGGFLINADGNGHNEDLGNFPFAKFLFKTDSNGNLLWAKNLNIKALYNIQVCWGGNMNVLPDSSYIFAYQGRTIGEPDSNSGGKVVVTKLDKEGKMKWTKKYFTFGDDGRIDISTLPDGSSIVSSCRKYGFSFASSTHLMKIDSSGNVVWENHVSGDLSNGIELSNAPSGHIIALNGDILIAGYDLADIKKRLPNGDSVIVSSAGSENGPGFLGRFSSIDGSLKWYHKFYFPFGTNPPKVNIFGNSIYNYSTEVGLAQVQELPNQDILITGWVSEPATHAFGGWDSNTLLLRLGPDGCMPDQDCNKSMLLPVPEITKVSLKKDEISIFPNPSSIGERLTVKFASPTSNEGGSEIRVINLQGQLIYSKIISKNEEETILELPNAVPQGAYLVSYLQNGAILSTKKWIYIQ